jgi:hypothetical protein
MFGSNITIRDEINLHSALRPAEAVDHLGRPITCGSRTDGGPPDDPGILHRDELFCSDFGVGSAETYPGGCSLVERSMTKSDQFREYADEALHWSRQSNTEEEKKALLDLAVTWTQAAALSEKSVGPLRA